MIRARLALLGVLLYAAPALAQTLQPPVEPSEPADLAQDQGRTDGNGSETVTYGF